MFALGDCRHSGHDRKTVRAYFDGDRAAWGMRESVGEDPFDRFEPEVLLRLADDRHLWQRISSTKWQLSGMTSHTRRSVAN